MIVRPRIPVLVSLLVVVALPASVSSANGGDCLSQALSILPREEYLLRDPKDSRFYAQGNVEGDVLHIQMRLATAKARSSYLRGSEQFHAILSHFSGKFRYIAGDWVGRSGLTTNLDKINALTGPPRYLPLAEAAKETWTGRQAAAAGYSEAIGLDTTGTPGKYTEVHVVFEKPVP